jgi:hypothetical protein
MFSLLYLKWTGGRFKSRTGGIMPSASIEVISSDEKWTRRAVTRQVREDATCWSTSAWQARHAIAVVLAQCFVVGVNWFTTSPLNMAMAWIAACLARALTLALIL